MLQISGGQAVLLMVGMVISGFLFGGSDAPKAYLHRTKSYGDSSDDVKSYVLQVHGVVVVGLCLSAYGAKLHLDSASPFVGSGADLTAVAPSHLLLFFHGAWISSGATRAAADMRAWTVTCLDHCPLDWLPHKCTRLLLRRQRATWFRRLTLQHGVSVSVHRCFLQIHNVPMPCPFQDGAIDSQPGP